VLLGDVSAAHDLGALSLLRDVRLPLVVVVLDNGGGRIFDRLPIATAELPDHAFARLYHTDPRGAAALAARGLGLRVAAPTTMEELDDALTDALAQPNATLLDVKIDPDADATLRQLLEAELRA
jgi:2-succinyl-5-enolpyruvyl-6-hydroxy-3-cyclohexene-1-carboxylate synthase